MSKILLKMCKNIKETLKFLDQTCKKGQLNISTLDHMFHFGCSKDIFQQVMNELKKVPIEYCENKKIIRLLEIN